MPGALLTVNDQPLKMEDERELHSGDRLGVGHSHHFRFKNPTDGQYTKGEHAA